MRIVIVGPGAMGCLFAGLLAKSNQEDLWILDKSEIRAKQLQKNGLKLEGISGEHYIRIEGNPFLHVTSDTNDIGKADLILICVKSYNTKEASVSVSPIVKENTVIMTLQNGLNNIETISDIFGQERIIAGITTHGATLLGIGHVRHAGIGKTIIGEVKQGSITENMLNQIVNIFREAGFETSISENILNHIWGKLIINAAINPISALTRMRNGELIEHEETKKLLHLIADESAYVAKARLIELPYDDPTLVVEETCRATANNISSMLQDVLNHKQTEIDSINGAIVKEGSKVGINTPINQVFTYLVKGLELSNYYRRKDKASE